MTTRRALALALTGCALSTLVACGDGAPSKYPPQPEGCNVQVFKDAPRLETDNIGTASASCDESVSDEDCLRTLKDQVCKLGGDVVWGVPDKPTLEGGKKKLSARAAHSKAREEKKKK